MRALRVLSLGNNMIENVPSVIASLDIRILKLAGNPLNPDLMKIVEGGTVSPSHAALPDNERDVIMTRKLKKYLRSVETAARDSGGESRYCSTRDIHAKVAELSEVAMRLSVHRGHRDVH